MNPILDNYKTEFEHGLGVIINKNPDNLVLDPGVSLNGLVDCIHKVTIEKDVMFGHDTMLLTGGHDPYKFGEERKASDGGGDIYIEEGVWIASRAIIIGPCRIGKHSVIGAGSVISKDIPAYSIVISNQLQILKTIPH